jgi:peptide/nickel transport system permease protein
MIPVILGVILIVYCISYFAPGDPVMTILGTAGYTPEKYDALQKSLGLDQPFFVQYLTYIKNVFLHGDFGQSYAYRNDIATELVTRAPYSLKLGLLSIVVMVVLAIPAGIISAVKQYSVLDNVVTVVSMFLAGMPNFWFAILMMLLFNVKLGWLPASGVKTWTSWIMPVLSLSLTSMASVLRMTRSSVLEVIRQDYIRTARAKGISEGKVISRHVLKNALIPVLTVVGMQLGGIIGGSVVIETIFNMPGIGNYMMSAISNRDYPAINGCVLVLSISICVVNLIVDVLYAYVDPRIKAQYEAEQKPWFKKKKEAAQ